LNNELITKSVKLCLFGLIAVCFINIFSNIMQINLINDYLVKNLYSKHEFSVLREKNLFRVNLIYGLYMLFLFSSFFLIGRWFYVCAKINHISRKEELKFSPGWSVGWYFIPFANLVMPYRSLKETYKASFKSENWHSIKIPYDFPFWWSTWLLANWFDWSKWSIWLGDVITYSELNQASYIEICSDVFLIVNSFFLIRIINVVYRNQIEND